MLRYIILPCSLVPVYFPASLLPRNIHFAGLHILDRMCLVVYLPRPDLSSISMTKFAIYLAALPTPLSISSRYPIKSSLSIQRSSSG